MKFITDEMFQRLGRWLRAAGYDVVIVDDGRKDHELIEQAIKENRLLLTADRQLAQQRHGQDHIIALDHESVSASIHSLNQQCPVNWLYRPFSRCMLCNTPLQNLEASDTSLPEDVKQNNQQVLFCPCCDKYYWEGSHVQRMRRQLKSFQTMTMQAEKNL